MSPDDACDISETIRCLVSCAEDNNVSGVVLRTSLMHILALGLKKEDIPGFMEIMEELIDLYDR